MADKLNINGFVGNPDNIYQQHAEDTCAIKSQQLILKEYGINVSEEELVQLSMQNGWYTGDGSGTQLIDIGRLIAEAGIPVTQHIDANVYDIADHLANGHQVIVTVDSSELWEGGILEWLKDLFFGNEVDHALLVVGIDNTDPDNPMVLVTDPGTGEACKPYPLDQFMDAWSDSQHFMVTTDIPTPSCINNFEAAGITDMHLPAVANVPYNDFLEFQAYSHQIDPSQLSTLNNMFDAYSLNSSNWDFQNMLTAYDLPAWDMNLFPPVTPMWNPYEFEYNNFGFSSFDTPMDFAGTPTPYDQHRLDTLQDLHDSALEHYQQCMDDGMYISATMWQQQANDIQSDINDMTYGG